ncbi:LPXTG cell wall anchor domain-containing protein [Listeria grandensis]|nr:LPXTG cell wall anchor domain-containing protein [Listeria grandensis]
MLLLRSNIQKVLPKTGESSLDILLLLGGLSLSGVAVYLLRRNK